MTRPEAKCGSPDFLVALSSFDRLHDLRFHGQRDFHSFLQEFERRFDDFNRIPGDVYLDEDHKCLLFLTALSDVGYFRDWITLISKTTPVAGYGTGLAMDFRSLALKAVNWNFIQWCGENPPYRGRQRFDAV